MPAVLNFLLKKMLNCVIQRFENWSRNMYNLNSKRAIVDKNGVIEWISGSFGSRVSMLYPASILVGEGSA